MGNRCGIRRALIAGVMGGASLLHANAQATRQVAHVDATGSWIETRIGPDVNEVGSGSGGIASADVIWQAHDPVAIAQNICLADTNDETWVAWYLNSERLGYFRTTETNTPIFDYGLAAEHPDAIVVASAEDVSLGVIGVQAAGPVSIRAFDGPSGATPIWTYTFDPGHEIIAARALDVAADGSIVIAAAQFNGSRKSLLVVLDGADGAELSRSRTATLVSGIELSDDGARAVLTEGFVANVIETAGLTSLFSFSVSGAGSYARLSRNGLVATDGGFNYRAFRDTGTGWTLAYADSEASQWFGGMALSGDGDTLFAVSHDYSTGYLVLTYRIIDLISGAEIARTQTTGSGAYQDAVQQAQVDQDGTIFAICSWGTQDNIHPEVQIFDRDLKVIGSIDTPGSPFSIDLSRDGQYLAVGAKAVHANIFGNGGDAYTYEVWSDLRGDLNCDGAFDGADIDAFFLALGNPLAYTFAYPDCDRMLADLNDDGGVDGADIDAFFNCLGGGCP